MARNIGNVVNSINELVAELGLEKLSAADDPGTSHPAKQEDGKSQIQAASEGARSAENVKDNKEQVTGQSIAEASPGDAKKEPGKSNVANITTATFTGEDPKNEKGYVSAVTDPGTTHPASATAKTAEDLSKAATAVLAEVQKLAQMTVKNAAEAREKIASIIEAKPEEKDAAVNEHVTEYIRGYTKSAALVGELTADMLDGMAAGLAKQEKQAEGEDGAGAPPPEAGAEGAEGGAPAGVSEEAQALAQAAMQIAQELGCSPEEVLDAAEAELAQGGAGAGGAEAGAPAGLPQGGAPGMEVGASDNSEELKKLQAENAELKKQAEELAQIKAEKTAKEAADKQTNLVTGAVASALDQWAAKNAEAKK